MSKPKELNFFIEERNWTRGDDWYRATSTPAARVRGESSPNYTAYPQHLGVPERMHSVIPDAKLIYVVRDPLERIAAHWVHNYAKRREKGDLRATLHPCQHLIRGPQPVPHAAAAVPRALPARADARDRAGGAPHRAARRRSAGSSSSSASTRASATLTSASSAIRPRARCAPAVSPCASNGQPHARGAASCRRTSGWRRREAGAAASDRAARRPPRPRARRARRSCARTPSGSAS